MWPAKVWGLNTHSSSWVIDFVAIPHWYEYGMHPESKFSVEERERRRRSAYLSVDSQMLHVCRYVGIVCGTQAFQLDSSDMDSDETLDTKIYDLYHNVLKSRGITPRNLLHTIRKKRATEKASDI